MRLSIAAALALFALLAIPSGQNWWARAPSSFDVIVDHSGASVRQSGLKDTLVNLERQSWVAWQKRDGKFFQHFLSDDHVEVGVSGITNKATVVAGVDSPTCVVASYSLDKFELTTFDARTALLTYHAAQDTKCGGVAVPSPVWVSSLFVKRASHWQNALYQHTPIPSDTR